MHDWVRKFVAFDTETTGIDENARIIEFAAVLFEDGRPTTRWCFFLNPGDCDWADPKVQEAMGINEIGREQLAVAPLFHEIFPKIREALSAAPVRCAHSAAFDLRMLRQEFDRACKAGLLPGGQDRTNSAAVTLDTLSLDIGVNPGHKSRSLVNVAARWTVPYQNVHRASSDAEACGRVLLALSYALSSDLSLVVVRAKEWQKERERYLEQRGLG